MDEVAVPLGGEVDLSAPVQSLGRLGLCGHENWVLGECVNASARPSQFMCLVHPAGVQLTLGYFSGGAFRLRSDTTEDTVYFRDGSTKPASKSRLRNVSAIEINKLHKRARETPGDVRALQHGVRYMYGDHWSLSVADDESIEIVNSHTELMMVTTFDGRSVTTASERFPAGSRSVISLGVGAKINFTNAWGNMVVIFDSPSTQMLRNVSVASLTLRASRCRT